ncbi:MULTISPECIES: hypothetical protein [Mesorhizobium]|uniref:hypothetical protein n=1 Tax=Mesorhizobium TaxID=68287 RepID=UPI0007ECA91D|nr:MULTISPECIES: hypothetical protein [Mesorhizobium]TPJ43721.1 hypothetical protein FJ437_20375 [Mesorhizobium sp. B2-6-6]ARP67349.1 hypothetical protein A9K65_031570 [Mesorhizobium sp. WSM1497]MCA0002922.1 hypothetical protein [Mesorhizobium sp. B264B2A]MCA0009208.1 hypothetical protein [Mesorhizobium sp. B264B1B]MCA0013991.1 hypothetical protein [Mesorhizobium sp. B294B1A1]
MSFERKIWKGVPTKIEENPWQAAHLIDEDLYDGSVIAEQWIVAAADWRFGPEQVRCVGAGSQAPGSGSIPAK